MCWDAGAYLQCVEPGLKAGELEVRGSELIAGDAGFVLGAQERGFESGDSIVEGAGGRFGHEPDGWDCRVGEWTVERLGSRGLGREPERFGNAWADAQSAGKTHAVKHGLDGGSRPHGRGE